jgi:hypothetical protein
MRVYINVDTKEEAFDLAMRQWSDDLKCVRIEEVVDEGWPRRWTLTWPLLPQIERSPNDYCDVGYHLVSALINGDVSGIESDDEHQLEEFIAQYPNCVFTPDENEEGIIEESFARCEVTGTYNNCVTIKVFAR